MMRGTVLGSASIRSAVAARMRARGAGEIVDVETSIAVPDLAAVLERFAIEAVVLSRSRTAECAAARAVCEACVLAGVKAIVSISSAAAYGASPQSPGLMRESRKLSANGGGDRVAMAWRLFEQAAVSACRGSDVVLTILRPAMTPGATPTDALGLMLASRVPATLAGYDPMIQLLALDDLAEAICLALERRQAGVFNIAPDEAIPLRAAARMRGRSRVAIPYALHRGWNVLRSGLRAGPRGANDLDYLRYSWTVSNEKAKRELGFAPSRTSAEALEDAVADAARTRAARPPASSVLASRPAESSPAAAPSVARSHARPARGFDPFGLDEQYIARYGRTLLRFLQRWYWRIEVAGLEHLPREGRAVIAGMHRGFMPLDGVMTLHVIAREHGRIPRFLIHPGVGLRFPYLSSFMTKLGGLIACHDNAAYVLERDEILGIYPEGIRGAFTPYARAYRIGPSWRDDFVKMALRHRAPIVPFVTVGSAEIFPILGRIDWAWWKRYTGWPYIPLTPTFPIVPVPLPSKWHTQFLPPLHVEREYSPAAADQPEVVARISAIVKQQIEDAAQAMLRRRRSIFFGSVFRAEPALTERTT